MKMADLEAAKGKLVEALKDKTTRYWELMKNWYKRKISKDDFDSKAMALLGDANINLHNEFLFAILVKCQTSLVPEVQPLTEVHVPQSIPPSSSSSISSGRPKPKRQRVSPTPIEPTPYGALDPMNYLLPPKVQLAGRDLDSLLLCSHELLLPDVTTLHTRMLLGAWEAGLEGVSEQAAQLMMLALEIHIKNVLQALIAHRTSWQLKGNNFQHSFGRGLAGTTLSLPSSLPSSLTAHLSQRDRAEAEAAAVAARGNPDGYSEPINLFHVRDTLMLNRSSIPVHSLLCFCVERALAGMWHEGKEEESQHKTVIQWQQKTENELTTSLPPLAASIR